MPRRFLATMALGCYAMILPSAGRAGFIKQAFQGRTGASPTIYWKTSTLHFNAKSPPVKGTFLYYPRHVIVHLMTDCVRVLAEFDEPAKRHGILKKQHVGVGLYQSAPVPQKCSVVAQVVSAPSQSATLNVVISKKF
jgi:hypothetical protein